jgi:hypothetical protein
VAERGFITPATMKMVARAPGIFRHTPARASVVAGLFPAGADVRQFGAIGAATNS